MEYMNTDLAQLAISAALKANWKDALETNLIILKSHQNDIDALNRLARAYAELGNLAKARSTAQRVLKIDPFNSIATKSLFKWKGLKKGDTNSSTPSNAQVFLEEPGKTKICSLLFLGDPKIVAKLDSGDEVKIDTHSHRVCVTTHDGKYIGRLPDDLSARLKKFINLGNEYSATVKSSDQKDVKIFIKEIKRDKKIINQPSFSAEKIDYVTFTPPEFIHEKNDLRNISDEEDT